MVEIDQKLFYVMMRMVMDEKLKAYITDRLNLVGLIMDLDLLMLESDYLFSMKRIYYHDGEEMVTEQGEAQYTLNYFYGCITSAFDDWCRENR